MATLTATSSRTTSSLPSYRSRGGERDRERDRDRDSYDLKACLEILKKLAPRVTPDIPSLPSTSTSTANNNVTQASAQRGINGSAKRRSEDAEDKSVKRSRTAPPRSSSPEEGASAGNGYNSKGKARITTDSNKKHASSTTTSHPAAAASSATTNTTTAHKRSGSTSSVISLSELKARSSSAAKDKQASSSSLNNGSSNSRTKTEQSDGTRIVPTKQTLNNADRQLAQGSPLTISTQHPSASSANATSTISPTLPSPALTVSSHKDYRNTPQLAQRQSISAPSPDNAQGASPSSADSTIWTRDRFKRIAAICREKGRALKHSGDKRMREYSSNPSPSASSSSSIISTTNGQPFNRHLTPILALFEQIDAVILYAYAFWCEDQAAGQMRARQASSASLSASTNSDQSATLGASTSSSTSAAGQGITDASLTGNGEKEGGGISPSAWKAGCIAENWKSIFGLVAFVRGRAEKMMLIPSGANVSKVGVKVAEGLPRAMEIVVAWMNMLEALILQHLTTNASRNLNSQASKLLGSISITSTGSTSGSTNGLSPEGNDNESTISSSSTSNHSNTTNSPNSPETSNFLQAFLKLQSDLEKIHTLWPASQNILLHPEQSALASSSSSSNLTVRDGKRLDGTSEKRGTHREEEDLLSLVLRKGRMAYDYEPTKLDDIVMPDLPRDEADEDEEEGLSVDHAKHEDVEEGDDMDAEGEVDPTAPSQSSLSLNKKLSSKERRRRSNAGPKSPEDLFKDEENYFRFSWPIVIHHPNSIAHTTSFGRALVFEMSSRLGIGYTSPSII